MAADRGRLGPQPGAGGRPTAGEEAILHREMGCTRGEFLAWLPGAVRDAPFEVDADLIRIRYAAGEVRIRIAQAAERRLGLLSLPVLMVSIQFVGIEARAREEFLKHFDLFTRRGGG
jgi:hypothetical protein